MTFELATVNGAEVAVTKRLYNVNLVLKYHLSVYGKDTYWKSLRGRDSSVCTATRYGLDGPGIETRLGARFSATVQTGPGAHPASYTMGTGFFPGVKRPGRDVDHQSHLAPPGLRGLF